MRVELLGQVFADDTVEGLGDDLAIEVLDVDLDLVGRGEEVDLRGGRACRRAHLLALAPDDAALSRARC